MWVGDLDRTLRGEGSRRGRGRLTRATRQHLSVAVCAVVAPLVGGAPVGSAALDWIWSAGLAALGAWLGTSSRRGPLLVASAMVLVCARSWPGLLAAGVAAGAAGVSTRHLRRRAVLARGLSGGASVISLLASGGQLHAVLLAAAIVGLIATIGASGIRHAGRGARRSMLLGGVAAGLFAFLAVTAAGLGVLQHRRQVDRGIVELRLGLAASRAGDVAGVATHLGLAETQLRAANRGLERWGGAARIVPVAAQNVDALLSVLAGVERATGLAVQAAALPDDDRLEVLGGSVDLDAIAQLQGPLGRLAGALEAIVDDVDDHRDGPILPQLRDRLDDLRIEAERAGRSARSGAQAAQHVPELLGASGERRYLVVFTTPSEARGRFGFPGSYAEVTFEGGRFRLGEHGSMSEAFPAGEVDQSTFDIGDPGIRPYVQYGATRLMLSATIPPDFADVGEIAAELWRQTGRPPVDGVLRFDPSSIAALLRFTGPVQVEGRREPLTADNAEDYLLLDQYLENPTDVEARRDVLDEVAEVTFERLEVVRMPGPRALFDLFGPLVREAHLHAYASREPEEGFLEQVGLGGELGVPPSDGVMVSTLNRLGNKIDAFLRTSISYTGEVVHGRAATTLAIDLANDAPPDGLPGYVIGSFAELLGQSPDDLPPVGTNRMTALAYTVLPATEIRVDGEPVSAVSERVGGWWLHSVPIDVPAESSKRIEIDLAGELADEPYSLTLVPGGAVRPAESAVALTVDGSRIDRSAALRAPTAVQ